MAPARQANLVHLQTWSMAPLPFEAAAAGPARPAPRTPHPGSLYFAVPAPFSASPSDQTATPSSTASLRMN
jgi:hypothetical protein